MQQIKETLYGEPSSGKAKQWAVYVDGDKVIVEYGRVGGKMQTKETICTGKNQGRANETTPEQQAILEATSKWDKQYKSKFYRPSIEGAKEMLVEGVMLSQKFIESGNKLPQMVYASRKLDGLRCKAVYDSASGEVKFVSRGNDTYPVQENMQKELSCICNIFGLKQLDGELFVEGLALQTIVSCVRVFDPVLTPTIVYNIFDAPMLDKTFEERKQILDKIQLEISSGGYQNVSVVEHALVDKDTFAELNTQYVAEGYEGVMFNDPEGLYHFQNKRPAVIQKYKSFLDSEAKVIDCTIDKNSEGVLMCEWVNTNGRKVTFECKMRGTHEYRLFENQQTLIGKWINFRYQQLTLDGKPQFPVAISERLCDSQGNPLE